MNFYKDLRHPLLKGFGLVILGLFICLFPNYILHSIAILLGALLIVSSTLILSEGKFPLRLHSQSSLLSVAALVSIACGFIIIIKPLNTTSFIFFAGGIWLFISAAIGIIHSATKAHKIKADRWQLLASVTVLVFALLIFMDPAGVAILLLFGIGAYLLLCGFLFIGINIYQRYKRHINLDTINSYLPSFLRYAK